MTEGGAGYEHRVLQPGERERSEDEERSDEWGLVSFVGSQYNVLPFASLALSPFLSPRTLPHSRLKLLIPPMVAHFLRPPPTHSLLNLPPRPRPPLSGVGLDGVVKILVFGVGKTVKVRGRVPEVTQRGRTGAMG